MSAAAAAVARVDPAAAQVFVLGRAAMAVILKEKYIIGATLCKGPFTRAISCPLRWAALGGLNNCKYRFLLLSRNEASN